MKAPEIRELTVDDLRARVQDLDVAHVARPGLFGRFFLFRMRISRIPVLSPMTPRIRRRRFRRSVRSGRQRGRPMCSWCWSMTRGSPRRARSVA